MTRKRAKVLGTGRSQAIRRPEELRFEGGAVLVRWEVGAVILEAADEWPEGYIESFSGIAASFERPPQGGNSRRQKLR
jgi:virulence-associated protein VagC